MTKPLTSDECYVLIAAGEAYIKDLESCQADTTLVRKTLRDGIQKLTYQLLVKI